MTKPRVLAVTGCTATGKSALAMALAQGLNGEIVCMDSMQVYRRMDVGTAKPTLAEQALVPHHMLDVVEPTAPYAVSDYAEGAEQAIAAIAARGRVPVLAGGTGLYLKSLLYGMTLGTVASDPQVRARLEKIALEPEGKRTLHDRLERADPETAARLHPNDLRRVIRALEVWELTGQPLSRQRREEPERPYEILPLALRMPRAELYPRIERRVRAMMGQGLLNEVRGLLESGVPTDAQSMQAIGYKELVPVALGREDEETAVGRVIVNTKHFAKRQETWFKGEERLIWMDAGKEALPEARTRALALAEAFLQGNA